MHHSETAFMKIDTINVSHWYQESFSNYEHLSDKWESHPSNMFLYCCIFKIEITNVSWYHHINFSRVKNWSSKWDSSQPCSSLLTHGRMCFCFFMSKRSLPYALRLLHCFNTIISWHHVWYCNHSIIVAAVCDPQEPIIGITLYKSCQTQTSN